MIDQILIIQFIMKNIVLIQENRHLIFESHIMMSFVLDLEMEGARSLLRVFVCWKLHGKYLSQRA